MLTEIGKLRKHLTEYERLQGKIDKLFAEQSRYRDLVASGIGELRNRYGSELTGTPEEVYVGEIERRFLRIPPRKILDKTIDQVEVGMSVRTYNLLYGARIEYVGELVTKTERELIRSRGFGRKSLNEVKEILKLLHPDLSLGMDIKYTPPQKTQPDGNPDSA